MGGAGEPTQPLGEKAARLARGGMRWARWCPVGSGTDGTWGWGLENPGDTLTGLEW